YGEAGSMSLHGHSIGIEVSAIDVDKYLACQIPRRTDEDVADSRLSCRLSPAKPHSTAMTYRHIPSEHPSKYIARLPAGLVAAVARCSLNRAAKTRARSWPRPGRRARARSRSWYPAGNRSEFPGGHSWQTQPADRRQPAYANGRS